MVSFSVQSSNFHFVPLYNFLLNKRACIQQCLEIAKGENWLPLVSGPKTGEPSGNDEIIKEGLSTVLSALNQLSVRPVLPVAL